ncbi:prostate stem cell antigen-like [Acipenser oxyrinchus oxyrinchus]|uniref:Prostate stem cell antigen-like n=1 Tax=Acipenser oxyrinchus oxyrinchus TaxID=40147 RepID=A0AAD8GF65_ACIOX|nr:prostate stem cell antigen-like [Acipenser oxyrinchus oxyrinchus]
MKTVLALLLLAFISSCAVEALTCYKCTTSLSNTDCNKNNQTCTTEDTCMTTVITAVGINTVSKQCSTNADCSNAAASTVSIGVLGGKKVTCCNTDLCNVSSSTTARLNVLLLGASAALLFLVSRITA